jgi:hypothetical protein
MYIPMGTSNTKIVQLFSSILYIQSIALNTDYTKFSTAIFFTDSTGNKCVSNVKHTIIL